MMLQTSIIEELTNTALENNRKRKENGGNITKKRRGWTHHSEHCHGSRWCHTTLEETACRDKALKCKEREAKMKSLAKGTVELEKMKGGMQKRMWKFPDSNSVKVVATLRKQQNNKKMKKDKLMGCGLSRNGCWYTKKTSPHAKNQKNKPTPTESY
jgi:hypothetical protein